MSTPSPQTPQHVPAPRPLQALVELLDPEACCRSGSLQQAVQDLAQWRLACGDIEGAACWQRLALSGCPQDLLRQQLQQLLEPFPLLRARLRCLTDWRPLQRALLRGHYARAEQLQKAMLAADSGPPQDTALLIALLEAWMQAGCWPAALQLLQFSEAHGFSPAEVDDASLSRCTAWLLEQQGDPGRAVPWRQRTQELESAGAGSAATSIQGTGNQPGQNQL